MIERVRRCLLKPLSASQIMTDLRQAFEYCHGLHGRLSAAIRNVEPVRTKVEELKSLAPTYPETRFCKAVLLPVVDQWTNEFLQRRLSATSDQAFAAMRCEGYADLNKYYSKTGLQTYFSGTPMTKDKQATGKSVDAPGAAYPDWCVRFNGAAAALRMVGEAKYAAGARSRSALEKELLRDLKYYLNIESDSATDWGHDYGYGVGYSAGGDGPRQATLVEDYWESDRILISSFCPRA